MGKLVNGQWVVEDVNPKTDDGEFVREPTLFRGRISKDQGSQHPPAKGRYHLYVSYACPWAHRTLIFRKLKGLEDYISVSVVSPYMNEDGWTFDHDFPGMVDDSVLGYRFLREVYLRAKSDCSGRVTVPILWDKVSQTIVSNESSEIIRMLNSEFNELTGNLDDYYPEKYRDEIDEINDFVYHNISNGVYKTGFALNQSVYQNHVKELFSALDLLEKKLGQVTFLVGDQITEADIRLFVTLIRFDPVYVGHFKCNIRRIADYPNLFRFVKEIYHFKGISDTVHFDHIKHHYYGSHKTINPTGVVPVGPEIKL